MSTLTLTRSQEVAVEAVRLQAEADGFGPLFILEDVGTGHRLHGGDGVCPDCDRLQVDSAQHLARKAAAKALGKAGYFPDTCFDHAAHTVTVTYNADGHRALYGVPSEGPPSCWMS